MYKFLNVKILDGLIEVAREGEELAFISWKDEDPLPIKYFSFCTWSGVEAKWFFDCSYPEETMVIYFSR